MTVRVLVADDQDLVRTGLTMILDAQPDIEVVGQAADGHAAIDLARRLRPDVCLVDIRRPGLDGIAVTELLAGRGVPDPMAVVVITTFDLDEYVHGALRAGARGFLLKDAGPELLVQAVHAAAVGDALIAPNITRRLLSTLAAREPSRRRTQPLQPLTDREEQDPDWVLWRSDGQPVFHFVNVVDDLEMGITHVIRGDDHLTNTAKHIALFRAFGVAPPAYTHLPLILNEDGSKMSKRDRGAVVTNYEEDGFAPGAVVNYLALLGWSPVG